MSNNKLARFAEDVLDQMGERFDLPYTVDGMNDQQAWIKHWDQVVNEVWDYLNAIPVALREKGEGE